MMVPRYNIKEIGEPEPKHRFEGEEFGTRFAVEAEDFLGVEKSEWCCLRHGITELTPQGALVVDTGWNAGPSGI